MLITSCKASVRLLQAAFKSRILVSGSAGGKLARRIRSSDEKAVQSVLRKSEHGMVARVGSSSSNIVMMGKWSVPGLGSVSNASH